MKLRAGRVLSRANENRLREAAQAITDVLAQLESGDEQNSREWRAAPATEYQTFNMTDVRVRRQGDQPIIEGYAAVYNRRSVMLWDFQEEIMSGAFAGTLKRNPDIFSLWQHNAENVLGRTTSKSLRLWEDSTGLGFELRPAPTQAGRDAVISIERGDVDKASFGFQMAPEGQKWFTDENGVLVRQLIEVDVLFEVSPVTWPAYPDTAVSVRSMLRCAPEWVQRALLPDGVDHNDDSEATRARTDLLQKRLRLMSI